MLYAPTDILLSGKAKPQPGILFISKDRLHIIKDNYTGGAPVLVIEILSPSTANYDRVVKGRMYYKHGVKEYWLVDPDHTTVEIFVHGETNWNLAGAYSKGDIPTSPLLGFEIDLANVFTRPGTDKNGEQINDK